MTGSCNAKRVPQNDNGAPDDKIVTLPTLAERDRIRRERESGAAQALPSERLVNMPPATLSLLGLIIGIHIVTHIVLPPERLEQIILNFGFIPARFTDGGAANPAVVATSFTHMFLHGGWFHLAMNGFMLAAFGSGIEKWLGSARMITLFVLSGLIGAATHFALNQGSPYPMIGASGGISGLFAAALMMMNRGQRELGGRFGLLPLVLVWVGTSIAFGMLGGPDGSAIAWASHVGGFLGGFLILKAMRV